jgi:hypothetical protein
MRFFLLWTKKPKFPKWNLFPMSALSGCVGNLERFGIMLVERALQVMNVEVVGDAYAIASNYLRRSGAIPDNFVTDDRLLKIIVEMFRQGEFNRLRLANRAIAKFEADERG